jgi:hypothetical protein
MLRLDRKGHPITLENILKTPDSDPTLHSVTAPVLYLSDRYALTGSTFVNRLRFLHRFEDFKVITRQLSGALL